ncbi:Srb8p [Sugiyamaella lignohabitans]|uniref:Mediator of RNA polymerase II transcription subunit 12 n=1 Tax=Sugiyamaella lignohabitans TaxID=796027 RepID=A0A167DE02_9ASCO|nr:Srb8p [Sugiyamaella lignohabitans]ANB12809.1 Srb8p [Sugiyamaella lignohabitans]
MSRRVNIQSTSGPPSGGGGTGSRVGGAGSGANGRHGSLAGGNAGNSGGMGGSVGGSGMGGGSSGGVGSKYGNFLTSSSGGGPRLGSSGGSSGGSGGLSQGRQHLSSSMSARDNLSELRYVLTEPTDVYPLPNGNHLPKIYPDFEPWRRSKEEDTVALDCLQRGHHEQPKVTNESGSGKASMIPLLKQWTSLPALSFFLVNAMEIRERNCRISSNWTFKPPPRVTLTDQKREAWLRDLASPSVPLRRLSRTIPHGIRNRSLLEHCCNKSIPISRAVWFARCVGANELRGLKRKGMGSGGSSQAAEAAWIRDWSEEVVGYIEKLIKEFPADATASSTATNSANVNTTSNPVNGSRGTTPVASSPASGIPQRSTPTPRAGTPPVATSTASLSPRQAWKFKIEYMTRLSAYLFYEQLLDKDIFLKWTLKLLHNGTPEELPIALIFIRMLWKELISNRSYSQLLALALLHQYSTISKLSTDLSLQNVFKELLGKIAKYAKELLLISSDSFVMPKNWRILGPVLSEVAKPSSGANNGRTSDTGVVSNSINSSSARDDSDIYSLLETIRIRNESLLVGGSPMARASRSGKAVFIRKLDGLTAPYKFDSVSADLMVSRLTRQEILNTLFTWATTRSRIGRERIFICLGLCIQWKQRHDWEISPSFLSFLIGISNVDCYDMDNVYDLVAEFVDHGLVSLGGYFRQVISSGILFVSRLQARANTQMLILNNLPLVDKTDSYVSQQRMLLSGLRKEGSSSTINAQDDLEQTKSMLRERLKFLFTTSENPHEDEDDSSITKEELSMLEGLRKESKIEMSDYLVEAFDSSISKG